MSVVLLSGGTGGAKLARGPLRPPRRRAGGDRQHRRRHRDLRRLRLPDPDLVTYWLADRIDERGWGIDGDTFGAMEMLRELGVEVWFQLGDRDLAFCLERRRLLDRGQSLSEAHATPRSRALGVSAQVIPMSDDRVRTTIRSGRAHARAAGVSDRARRRRGDRRRPLRGRRRRGRLARRARGARCGTGDHHRPVQSDHLDRADPRDRRDPRRDRGLGRPRRRGQPDRRRQGAQGARPAPASPGREPPPTRPASRATTAR